MTRTRTYPNITCPTCGARPGKRCGWWQDNTLPGRPPRRVWKHSPGLVHPARVELAEIGGETPREAVVW